MTHFIEDRRGKVPQFAIICHNLIAYIPQHRWVASFLLATHLFMDTYFDYFDVVSFLRVNHSKIVWKFHINIIIEKITTYLNKLIIVSMTMPSDGILINLNPAKPTARATTKINNLPKSPLAMLIHNLLQKCFTLILYFSPFLC